MVLNGHAFFESQILRSSRRSTAGPPSTVTIFVAMCVMIAKHALLSKSCTNIGVAQSIRRRQMLVLARTYFYQFIN